MLVMAFGYATGLEGERRDHPARESLCRRGAGRWVERFPGVFWKMLWEDPDGKHKAILMRYEPGATIPRHRHIGDEQIFVLEGSVQHDTGVCTAGNYARRAA